MRRDRTDSHVGEWAALVDEEVPELRSDDEGEGKRDCFRPPGR